MTTARRGALVLSFLFGLSLAACSGSDDKQDAAAPDTSNDLNTPDVADTTPVDADTATPDLAPDQQVPDLPPDQGTDTPTPTECDPECNAATGHYCDSSDWTCKSVQCVDCASNRQCGDQGVCIDLEQEDGSNVSVCSATCIMDDDCGAGFKCSAELLCTPRALCPSQLCTSEGVLGDPCPQDSFSQGCAPCGADLVCAAQILDITCTFDTDCVDQGLTYRYNPVCTSVGTCAYSYCTGHCTSEGTCPEGFGPMLSGFSCYCIPVGTSQAGEGCPFMTVHTNADDCDASLACLGIPASEDSSFCTVDADCTDPYFRVDAQCVGGRCGLSFCSPRCKAGLCEDGFSPIDVGGSCYCAPVYVGDAAVGAPCSPYGTAPTSEQCQAGTSCIAMEGEAGIDTCSTAADCPASVWYRNIECVDGLCNSSFCSAYCAADGSCPAGYHAVDVGVTCMCFPKEVGEQTAGEGCAMSFINSDMDFCQEGLVCLGFTDIENAPECLTAEDCDPTAFLGQRDCVDGKCTASFCSAECNQAGKCPVGFFPIEVGEEGASVCYCAPKNIGTVDLGGACASGQLNAYAGGCLPELTCITITSDPTTPDACEMVSDCSNQVYLGTIGCIEKQCASSFCSVECTEGTCPDGYAPSGETDCYCQPIPPPTCLETCLTGCCWGELCITTITNARCGLPGSECVECPIDKVCTDGLCTTPL